MGLLRFSRLVMFTLSGAAARLRPRAVLAPFGTTRYRTAYNLVRDSTAEYVPSSCGSDHQHAAFALGAVMSAKHHPNNAPGLPMLFPVWLDRWQMKYMNPVMRRRGTLSTDVRGGQTPRSQVGHAV